MVTSITQSSFKRRRSTQDRVVKFADDKQENSAIAVFLMHNFSFSYLDNDKYVITTKQCKLLKSKKIGFKVFGYR